MLHGDDAVPESAPAAQAGGGRVLNPNGDAAEVTAKLVTRRQGDILLARNKKGLGQINSAFDAAVAPELYCGNGNHAVSLSPVRERHRGGD